MTGDPLDTLAHVALAPFDRARVAVLERVGTRIAPLFADRALRTTMLGLAAAALALGLTRWCPIGLLVVGPLALGVPHLVADVRYLVARPGLHRRPTVVVLALAPLALAFVLRPLELTALAMLGAGLAARGPIVRRALVVFAGLGLGTATLELDRRADVVFAHVHNVVAILLWWSLRPSRRPLEWLVPATIAACALALATGLVGPRIVDTASFEGTRTVVTLLDTLSPTADPVLAERWLLVFAFGQSMHYAAWLRLIPEDARERRAPRPFVSTYRALRRDLGALGLVTGIAVAIGFVAYAFVDVERARLSYLRLALFHGPMEIGLVALAFAERRRL